LCNAGGNEMEDAAATVEISMVVLQNITNTITKLGA
jgi:hypothetical protein